MATRGARASSPARIRKNTGGFGDIGLQFQQSPVDAAISNVHISNEGDNNSNNTIVGNDDAIINGNVGASANAYPAVATAAAPAEAVAAPADPPAPALPASDSAQASAPQSVNVGDQSHCGVVAGIGASGGGSGSGDTRCTSVESGGDSQVNTDGFGDIGMQFQESPVNAPITNVHNSNEGDNNSNNTIVGNNNFLFNFNFEVSIHT